MRLYNNHSKDNSLYSHEFYRAQEKSDGGCAIIANLLNSLINPHSVVDVGCGIGQMILAMKTTGVDQVIGIDGPWVPMKGLMFPEKDFISIDFTDLSFPITKQFDLVVCLEVAEHLPPQNAKMFINFLASLGPIVAFSAAIPFQGGVNHVNEQWPSYWSNLFAEEGFVAVDCLRQRLINDNRVATCYSQNLILFVLKEKKNLISKLMIDSDEFAHPLPVVHPEVYQKIQQYANDPLSKIGLAKVLQSIPRLIIQGIRRRFFENISP